MFKKIVWATDGSEHADSTLPLVGELARVHGSRIVAVHVDERFCDSRSGGGPILAAEDELPTKIRSQVEELEEQGFAVDLEVVQSGRHDTSAVIAATAAEVGADLIVVGTHGCGEFESVALGSVARALTHDARCPVLVVPPAAVPAVRRQAVTVA
jgi:nucleotide-binding universal stress UspA family protein